MKKAITSIDVPKIGCGKIVFNDGECINEYNIDLDTFQDIMEGFEVERDYTRDYTAEEIRKGLKEAESKPVFGKSVVMSNNGVNYRAKIYEHPFEDCELVFQTDKGVGPLKQACIIGSEENPYGLFIPFTASRETCKQCSEFLAECAKSPFGMFSIIE